MAAPAPPAPAAELTEAQCIAALARLEEMGETIQGLRLVIPLIIDPLGRRHPTPQHLREAFQNRAIDGCRALGKFNKQWNHPEYQALLARAKSSHKANHDLSASEGVPEYGWPEMLEEQSVTTSVSGGMQDTIGEGSNADMEHITKVFSEGHPDLRLELDSTAQTVRVLPKNGRLGGYSNLGFSITWTDPPDGQRMYDAGCLGNMKFHQAVTRCLATRQNPSHLGQLLEMIASYSTAQKPTCAKCGRKLDRNAFPPAARRPNPIPSKGPEDSAWQAVHEDCL